MAECRILVVDDDPTILDFVDTVLQGEGHRCLRATRGEQALAIADQIPLDLILLDWRLPGLTGREVARRLRARGIRAPIVVFTAAGSARDWDADPHVTGVLTKPFELDDLLAVVARYCPSPVVGVTE